MFRNGINFGGSFDAPGRLRFPEVNSISEHDRPDIAPQGACPVVVCTGGVRGGGGGTRGPGNGRAGRGGSSPACGGGGCPGAPVLGGSGLSVRAGRSYEAW